jgi:hypothetical protein
MGKQLGYHPFSLYRRKAYKKRLFYSSINKYSRSLGACLELARLLAVDTVIELDVRTPLSRERGCDILGK